MITIARVGDRGNENDAAFREMQRCWTEAYRPDLDLQAQDDRIDLNEGRDFLQEDKTYDIVVLHYLYKGDGRSAGCAGTLNTSRLQSREAWGDRLCKSCAKLIFVFGYYTEVSHYLIGELPHYHLHKKEMWAVYELTDSLAPFLPKAP